MKSFKQKIADLDNPETTAERKEGQVLIMYNQGTEKFYQVEKGMEPISVGEIMTDGDWGIEYYLDPETIPRNIRKRYIIESAKNRIQSKLDEQIIIDEISNQKTDKFKRETYGRIKADAEKGYDPTGIIAEKMVKNFLKKLTYDSDVNFRLIEADVFQDVEQKVDFIIHRKKHTRGVGVDENDQSGDIGIQFTTNPSQHKLRQKSQQIERAKSKLAEEDAVEDIVLVSIPLNQTRDIYRKWSLDKSGGGPDKLWTQDTKETIFKEVMKDFLAPKEIQEQWGKVK
jgi:hypothetical protein